VHAYKGARQRKVESVYAQALIIIFPLRCGWEGSITPWGNMIFLHIIRKEVNHCCLPDLNLWPGYRWPVAVCKDTSFVLFSTMDDSSG
jgi:hypothetical protein